MTIQEMRKRKQELGYSYETISKLSGLPLGTVQKTLGGITRNPRQATLEALSKVFAPKTAYPDTRGMFVMREPPVPYGTAAEDRVYTIKDIEELPEGIRAELIDGRLYYMASPGRLHQKIIGELYLIIANYIKARGGACEVYLSPFGVYLDADDTTFVEPDLVVICDTEKLDEKGCHGAPDWVVEVLSPSSKYLDCLIKQQKYQAAGVREYWLIEPHKRMVIVYRFKEPSSSADVVEMYSFDDEIPCSLYPDLKVRLSDSV